MTSIDLIRSTLQMTQQATLHLVDDMRNAPMTRSLPNGHHAIWLMGHLCFVEGAFRQVLKGEQNPVSDWAGLFAPGTHPSDDASRYPSLDSLIGRYAELRNGTLAMVEDLSDPALDQKPHFVPAGFEDAMRTVGQALMLLNLHNMVHYGQIAECRRAAGRQPLM